MANHEITIYMKDGTIHNGTASSFWRFAESLGLKGNSNEIAFFTDSPHSGFTFDEVTREWVSNNVSGKVPVVKDATEMTLDIGTEEE